MMKTAYLAIDYICNEQCRFCPCSKDEKKAGIITCFLELKNSIDAFCSNDIHKLVISGGEPTLHPQLPDIIHYAQNLGIEVVLLSNSERFSEPKFFENFLNKVNVSMLTVITTLHSSRKEKHERANQTPNSFKKTIDGLGYLCNAGVNLILKHCITKHNYQDLTEFYNFVDNEFPEKVSIQLCSIDYCGIPENLLAQEMLPFPDIRSHLEMMFDTHMKRCEQGSKRNLYCINIPLCSCDVYYWGFMRLPPRKIYEAYKDPHSSKIIDASNNVGTFGEACKHCKAFSICNGTYRTAFQCFGDTIVKPY